MNVKVESSELSTLPTREDRPLVAILVLNWNGWQDTIQCLESVRRLDYPDYLTVLVDNGSVDGSMERFQAWAAASLPDPRGFVVYSTEIAVQGGVPAQEKALDTLPSKDRCVLIRNRENLGFAGGNNVTFQYALGRPHAADYVFLLNNDATVEPDALGHLVAVDQKSRAGIVGALMKERSGEKIIFPGLAGSWPLLRLFFDPLLSFRPADHQPGMAFCPSYWVCGGAMMIRRDVLEGVRKLTGWYFDEALFLYAEEVDFCGQARKLGFESVMASRAVVRHAEATSSGGRFNPTAFYYINRNRVRVAAHLLPAPWRPLFHAFNIPVCLGRAAKNFLQGRRVAAGTILRGTLDGYRGRSGKWQRHDELARRPAAPMPAEHQAPHSPPTARVAIVIVNWNGWRDTLECLESVRCLDYPDYLTVVVDNASQDDSLARVREWASLKAGFVLADCAEGVARAGGEPQEEAALRAAAPAQRAVLIQGATNTGAAGGGNLGIEYALRRDPQADYVFLLDNDATAPPDTLTQLVELDRSENAGIVGGVVISQRTGQIQFAERTTLLRWFFHPLVKGDLPLPGPEVDYWPSAGVSGPAMLIRRDTLEAVHAATGRYLAPETFIDGWEFDFCYRSSLAQFRSLVTRRGWVRHKGERTTRNPLSPKRYYYTTRSRMLLAQEFLPWHWRVLFDFWSVAWNLGRVGKVLRLGRPDVARAILCGWRDGWRGEKGIWDECADRCTLPPEPAQAPETTQTLVTSAESERAK
jgi:hypothetical protein